MVQLCYLYCSVCKCQPLHSPKSFSSFEFNNDVDNVSLAIAALPKIESETEMLCAMWFVSLKKNDGNLLVQLTRSVQHMVTVLT